MNIAEMDAKLKDIINPDTLDISIEKLRRFCKDFMIYTSSGCANESEKDWYVAEMIILQSVVLTVLNDYVHGMREGIMDLYVDTLYADTVKVCKVVGISAMRLIITEVGDSEKLQELENRVISNYPVSVEEIENKLFGDQDLHVPNYYHYAKGLESAWDHTNKKEQSKDLQALIMRCLSLHVSIQHLSLT